MEEIKQKGMELLGTVAEKGCSAILILSDEKCGIVVAHGNSSDLCAVMHTCFEAYKSGEGTPSQIAFADMILDVISMNFSPSQMIKEMNKHINELI